MPDDRDHRPEYRARIERLRRDGRLSDAEAERAYRLLDVGRYGDLEGLLRARALVDRDHDAGPSARGVVLVLAALVALVVGLHLAAAGL
ncbi:MAG: hypothetical protein ABEJ05_05415 [Haloglomus sp.]